MFLCKSSRPMIDDSFSVSLSSSKRRLNLRQNSRILKNALFRKTLFDFKLARNNTNAFCKRKLRRRVWYARDEREVSVRLATERRRELFAILLFFLCGGVLSLFF